MMLCWNCSVTPRHGCNWTSSFYSRSFKNKRKQLLLCLCNISEKLQGLQTNNRAEITAAVRGLQSAIKGGYKKVEIKTDSQYTISAITGWIQKWKRNGWKTADSADVKNKEDFQLLDSLCQQIQVKWTYVKGHAGIYGNEKADLLAKLGGNNVKK